MRRAFLLQELARITDGTEFQGWGVESVRGAVRTVGGRPWPWRRRPRIASSELLSSGAIAQVRRSASPSIVDIHDHQVAQAEALGRVVAPTDRQTMLERLDRNIDLFPILAAPSASFVELAGLDPTRTIVAPNGTDVRHVTPKPFPPEPAVGMVSGAAPGRGIEALIEACRSMRTSEASLRLHLWLVAGDETGRAYLDHLERSVRGDPWIVIGSCDYEGLGDALALATILVVPHPSNAYMDVAVPVKLVDSMAAGRPVVVTPRREMRRIVLEADAGAVTSGDTPDDLAAAMLPILQNAREAERLGANARAAAVADFDWAVIGRRLAEAVLERLGDQPGTRLES